MAESESRRAYIGDLTTIGELSKKDSVKGLVVQAPIKGCGLPNFLVLELVQPSWKGKDLKTVTYLNPRDGFVKRVADVGVDTSINILSGKMAGALLSEFKDWQEGHLADAAGYHSIQSGSDPEVFVTNKDGEVVPAWTFLGSKADPTRAPRSTYGNNAVYWDGFQAEFDTMPNTCLSFHCDSVRSGLLGVYLAAQKVKAKLSIASVLPVSQETLDTGAEEHVQFGCMPSLNAYGHSGRKEHGRQVPFRFAGGHIHFGMKLAKNQVRIVKALDAILGVSCVGLFGAFDNPVRREYYGLAGEYRLPEHGLEYRTLSNAWLSHPVVMNLVFDLARRAVSYGYYNLDCWKSTEEETCAIINGHDVVGAQAVLLRNKAIFESLLKGNGHYVGCTDLAFDACMNGMDSIVKEPENLVNNWRLDAEWTGHCDGIHKNWHNSIAWLRAGKKV